MAGGSPAQPARPKNVSAFPGATPGTRVQRSAPTRLVYSRVGPPPDGSTEANASPSETVSAPTLPISDSCRQ